MKTRISLIALAVMAGAIAVYAASATCPIDNSAMYFTGQTKTVSGKMLYLYRCPQGHTSWVVQ